MGSNVRLGQLVLLAVVIIIGLTELVLGGISLQAGRFSIAQVVRVALTVWLLCLIWDGVGWARWVVAVLFLTAAVGAVGLALASPDAKARPEVMAFLVGAGVVSAALGIGLASPWVGAYQVARRRSRDDEPVDSPNPGENGDIPE